MNRCPLDEQPPNKKARIVDEGHEDEDLAQVNSADGLPLEDGEETDNPEDQAGSSEDEQSPSQGKPSKEDQLARVKTKARKKKRRRKSLASLLESSDDNDPTVSCIAEI